jgi:hypothetical protein
MSNKFQLERDRMNEKRVAVMGIKSKDINFVNVDFAGRCSKEKFSQTNFHYFFSSITHTQHLPQLVFASSYSVYEL